MSAGRVLEESDRNDEPNCVAKRPRQFPRKALTVNRRDVFVEQLSGALSLAFLQRINDRPVRLLYIDKAGFALRESKLNAHFEGQRIPGSEQNAVGCSRNDRPVKIHVVQSVGFKIVLTRRSTDGVCLIAKGRNISPEVRRRQASR
jgi:hypothetical protein